MFDLASSESPRYVLIDLNPKLNNIMVPILAHTSIKATNGFIFSDQVSLLLYLGPLNFDRSIHKVLLSTQYFVLVIRLFVTISSSENCATWCSRSIVLSITSGAQYESLDKSKPSDNEVLHPLHTDWRCTSTWKLYLTATWLPYR